MSRLSDLTNEVAAEHRDEAGKTDVHAATKSLVKRVRRDKECRETLMQEAAAIRVKAAAARGAKALRSEMSSPAQITMFPNLHRGYALDTDGRFMKATDALTEMEFERLIAIREKSIADDQGHLRDLRDARDAAKPIWGRHPAYTFGQCCGALAHRAAA